MKYKIVAKKPLVRFASISLLVSILTSGCGKNTCDLDYRHVHEYTKDRFITYYDSENSVFNGMDKSFSSSFDLDETQILTKYGLLRFEDNIDFINESYDKPITQYYYNNGFGDSGWIDYDDKLINKHYFTGVARDVYGYLYRGYKIEDDKLIGSDYVEDISAIKEEFPYFMLENFCTPIYSPIYRLNEEDLKVLNSKSKGRTLVKSFVKD